MKVLVVGSGGREHALAWKLAQSPAVEEVHAAPGNPGISRLGHCHPIRAEDGDSLLELARTLGTDLVVIGPEAPLVAGVADQLRRGGVSVFGPSAAAAQIEGSKGFAKDVMRAAGVPFAERMSVARVPCVVKADGLTAGKGVFVCRTDEELDAALTAVREHGEDFVIEELLEGEELSVFAIVDGEHRPALAGVARLQPGRRRRHGPEHGGHGLVLAGARARRRTRRRARGDDSQARDRGAGPARHAVHRLPVRRPDVDRRRAEGARVQLPVRRPGDAGDPPAAGRGSREALRAAARGDLSEIELPVADRCAVTIALAAGTYPAGRDTGSPITGVDDAEAHGAVVFHAGTAMRDGQLVTSGGRILNVTGVGETIEEARARAYEACERISFPDMRYRSDIAAKALNVAG